LFEHIPGNYCTAAACFLAENALTMNLALCTSAAQFRFSNFTAFETELTEMESDFQKE
jgi:hypothetical protein